MNGNTNVRWLAVAAAMAALLTAGVLATRPAGGGINGGGRYFGAIDEFGSIFVNGVEFELRGASIVIDGQSAGEGDLRLGQLVAVDGVVNLDGVTGNAVTVTVDSAVRGQASAVYYLLNSLLGLSLGPLSVALLTDHLFADPRRVGDALALVAVVVGPAMALVSWSTRAPFARMVANTAATGTAAVAPVAPVAIAATPAGLGS